MRMSNCKSALLSIFQLTYATRDERRRVAELLQRRHLHAAPHESLTRDYALVFSRTDDEDSTRTSSPSISRTCGSAPRTPKDIPTSILQI